MKQAFMKKSRRTVMAAAMAAAAVTTFTPLAHAQNAANYPTQPIRIIIPFAPGGSTDVVTRIVATKLGQILGQSIVVDNRGGAGGAIGAAEAARAAPDGYTLSVATTSTMAVNPACRKEMPYDPLVDFIPVTNFADVPNVIGLNKDMPGNQSFAAFLAELKANPGKYAYGSSGTCGVNHLFGEAFKGATDTDMTHVPYKGSGPAIIDLLGGQIQVLFDNLPSSMAQIQAGNIKPVATVWPSRVPGLENVPTLAELGYPQISIPTWYGLLAPKGTPAAIVTKLRDAVVQALQDPGVAAALRKQGAEPSGNTSEAFGAQIRQWHKYAKDVVTQRGIELQ